MKKLCIFLLIFVCCAFVYYKYNDYQENKNKTKKIINELAERYRASHKLKDERNKNIDDIININKIKGCSTYRYRHIDGELYKLYCSNDGERWKQYTINIGTADVKDDNEEMGTSWLEQLTSY